MSRIGKMPVVIPAGVTVTFNDGIITVKGGKGTLTQKVDGDILIKVEGAHALVEKGRDVAELEAKHGLYRALLHNMVEGVTKGFSKSLIINGVGYKAQMQGKKLVLNIGYSHPIEFDPPEGISIKCPSLNEVVVEGFDKTVVGQVAANIRAKRVVEPYHAYGIRYKDEVVVMKEGKTAGK